jgi:MSHA biogenesis protein MshP
MCPDPTKRQRGFGVIAAIVILVIFAGLSAFIASMSASQHMGNALDVQGSNAYLAAHAGLEWGKYQTSAAPATYCSAATIETTLTVNGYTVKVNCTNGKSGSTDEAGLGTIYSLTATACSSSSCPHASPGPNYVERRISALIER